jgi:predicted dehydrogenase
VAVHSRIGGAGASEPYYQGYGEFQLLARETSVTFPPLRPTEPLKEQARFFIDTLDKGDAGVASGERGWEVVRVLEAVNESMRRGGAPVPIAGASPASR